MGTFISRILPALLLAFSLLFSTNLTAQAHPGNTASDGCHYCRTNCDYWGEAYGERHCHGGYGEGFYYGQGPYYGQGSYYAESNYYAEATYYAEANYYAQGGYVEGSKDTALVEPVVQESESNDWMWALALPILLLLAYLGLNQRPKDSD